MIERFTLLSYLPTPLKKNYLIIYFLALLLPLASHAQDNCADAMTITDLSGGCSGFSSAGNTFDLFNGSCTTPIGAINTWFQFTAVGPNIDIVSTMQGGINNDITIAEFTAGNCIGTGAFEIACATSPMSELGILTVGTTYHILISNSTDATGNSQICVTNPPPGVPPPNDDICNPQNVSASGGCASGTTENATPDFGVGSCAGTDENSVWYTTTLGLGMTDLEIDIQGFNDDIMVVLYTFNPDCSIAPLFIDFYCGNPGGLPLTATGLTENTQYLIQVSSATADEGTFTVCLQESGPPPGCAVNDLCATAEVIPTPVTGVPCTSPVSGCNIGASPSGLSLIHI